MQFAGASRSQSLLDLVNISVLLEAELRGIGICTPLDLKEATASGAWERLRRAGIQHEAHVLFALEGAIQGIPWKELSSERRHALLADTRAGIA